MTYGIWPTNPFHLIALALPILLWAVGRSMARRRQIVIYHNSALAVAYWEEILFRGLLWGVMLALWNNQLVTLVITSVLFGMLHVRNRWWASREQVIRNCIMVTVTFAPVVSLLRWWSGDVYLCIALHALWNFAGMYLQSGRAIPTDSYLQSKWYRMNLFETLFSGFWLMPAKARTIVTTADQASHPARPRS